MILKNKIKIKIVELVNRFIKNKKVILFILSVPKTSFITDFIYTEMSVYLCK